jgi:hypothetical protein
MGYVDAVIERYGLGDIEIPIDKVGIARLQAQTNRYGAHFNSYAGYTVVPYLPLKIDGDLGSRTTAAVAKTAKLSDEYQGSNVAQLTGSKSAIAANKDEIAKVFGFYGDAMGLRGAPHIEPLMERDYLDKMGTRVSQPKTAVMPVTFLILGSFGLYFLLGGKKKGKR